MRFIKSIINFTSDVLETIVFIGSLYIVVYLFLFFPTSVQGASMEPTFHTGDRIIVSRVSYKLHQINRGDVIILKSPKNPDIEYIKRVVGLPGETIFFKGGNVYINGNLLNESYISVKTNVWENGFSKENVPIIIPDDYLFIMGDNRTHSSDSREFGPIPISSVIGKDIFRYYPDMKSP